MMIPSSFALKMYETDSQHQLSPELRRMDMLSRARREEHDALAFGMSPRFARRAARRNTTTNNGVARAIANVRKSLGNMLISAGERVHSA